MKYVQLVTSLLTLLFIYSLTDCMQSINNQQQSNRNSSSSQTGTSSVSNGLAPRPFDAREIACPICIETIKIDEEYSCLPCQHVFHHTCFKNLEASSRSSQSQVRREPLLCPTCRQELSSTTTSSLLQGASGIIVLPPRAQKPTTNSASTTTVKGSKAASAVSSSSSNRGFFSRLFSSDSNSAADDRKDIQKYESLIEAIDKKDDYIDVLRQDLLRKINERDNAIKNKNHHKQLLKKQLKKEHIARHCLIIGGTIGTGIVAAIAAKKYTNMPTSVIACTSVCSTGLGWLTIANSETARYQNELQKLEHAPNP